MEKKCFLCDLGGSADTVLDFNDETLKNCSLKLAFRKIKSFKYKDIDIINASLDFVGYHTTCYKKVTALSNKYKDEFNQFAAENTVSINIIFLFIIVKKFSICFYWSNGNTACGFCIYFKFLCNEIECKENSGIISANGFTIFRHIFAF